MKTTHLISVIVPVYNTELYLSDCIESVLTQTYPNLELILVDDRSEDRSSEICREACRMDPRVIFLPQEYKKGVSAARNRAVETANGSYLFFLDSDDMIHPGLLEALIRSAEHSGASIAAVLPCRIETEKFGKLSACTAGHEIPVEYTYMAGRTVLDWAMVGSREKDFLYSGIGGKLVQKERARMLRFDETMCNGEDTKYLYQLLEGGADAAVLEGIWYYYRMHSGNASKNRSAEACISLYRCEKYICERERAAGKTANVLRQENMLINSLLEWYRIGHKKRDKALKTSMGQALRQERRSEEIRLLSLRYRMKIWFALYSYPVYIVLHKYFRWRWEQGERKRLNG